MSSHTASTPPTGRHLRRRRLREVAVKAGLLAASTGVCLILLEVLLRLFPSLLGQDFVNGLRSNYAASPEGIYYLAEDCEGRSLNLMKPDFTASMYYNGHTWLHRTDSYGFRNPENRDRADVVLVGDSMIYGHGLEIDDTVGVQLERMTGLTVANLGRQGDFAPRGAFTIGQHISRLRPGYLFYFFSENDVLDVYTYLDGEAMRDYIARSHGAEDNCGTRGPPVPPEGSIPVPQDELQLTRARRWLEVRQLQREALARAGDAERDGDSLGWGVTKAAIRRMRHTASLHGAELFLVPITPRTSEPEEILRRFAHDDGLGFVDSSVIDDSDPSLFLVEDGHLNPRGARRLARLVADAIAAAGTHLPAGSDQRPDAV